MERAVIIGRRERRLARFAGRSALERAGARRDGDPGAVDRSGLEDGEVQHPSGVVVQAGVGQIPPQAKLSRRSAILSYDGDANQVWRLGLRSATLAETRGRAGDYDVVLAAEGRVVKPPYILPKPAGERAWATPRCSTAMRHDGLLDAFEHSI